VNARQKVLGYICIVSRLLNTLVVISVNTIPAYVVLYRKSPTPS